VIGEATIQGSLGEVLDRLSRELTQFPRRVPGMLQIDDHPLAYADLHSFFHQAHQIYVQKLYDLEPTRPIRSILDCGAHIGLASIYYASRFPEAVIHGFEADPDLCRLAESNVRNLNLSHRITMHPKAIWTHDRGIGFNRTGDDSGNVSAMGSTQIPSVSLKEWILNHQVDLIKMDIEGSEYEVLRDCREALKEVPYVLLEAHAFGRHEGKLQEALSYLEASGFQTGLGDFHQATWIPQPKPAPFKACPTQHYVISVFAWRDY
jgi:FkbM family methyltransferase